MRGHVRSEYPKVDTSMNLYSTKVAFTKLQLIPNGNKHGIGKKHHVIEYCTKFISVFTDILRGIKAGVSGKC